MPLKYLRTNSNFIQNHYNMKIFKCTDIILLHNDVYTEEHSNNIHFITFTN